MPTIHYEDGFRFLIFTDDHEPAHVHVIKGGAMAKLSLGSSSVRPRILNPGAMSTPDARRAVRIVEANQGVFLARWREIHG